MNTCKKLLRAFADILGENSLQLEPHDLDKLRLEITEGGGFRRIDYMMMAAEAFSAYENLDGLNNPTTMTDAIYNIGNTCFHLSLPAFKRQSRWKRRNTPAVLNEAPIESLASLYVG